MKITLESPRVPLLLIHLLSIRVSQFSCWCATYKLEQRFLRGTLFGLQFSKKNHKKVAFNKDNILHSIDVRIEEAYWVLIVFSGLMMPTAPCRVPRGPRPAAATGPSTSSTPACASSGRSSRPCPRSPSASSSWWRSSVSRTSRRSTKLSTANLSNRVH